MKLYWVVEDHLDGELFLVPENTPEHKLEELEEVCDTCGDCDEIIGQFSDWQQLKKEVTDCSGWCPYSDEYLQSVFKEEKND